MSSYLLQPAFSKTKLSHISPSFQIQLLLIVSLFTTEISSWPQSFYSRKVKLLLALLCHTGTVLFHSVIFRLLFHYHCYLSRSNHFLLILNYCSLLIDFCLYLIPSPFLFHLYPLDLAASLIPVPLPSKIFSFHPLFPNHYLKICSLPKLKKK